MASDSIHLPSGLVERAANQFPWDIVVLAALAVGLGVCLYQVLGRRIGTQAVRQEPPGALGTPRGPVPAGAERLRPPPLPGVSGAERVPAAAERDIPGPATRVGDVLSRIGARVTGFTPDAFLTEAEGMFRKIVPAFAAGDRAALAGLMAAEPEEAFRAAIDARTEAGQTQRSDLRGIERLSILDAAIISRPDAGENVGEWARIEVSIVSRQVNLLADREGNPVLGTDAVTEFHDLWLFERSLDDGVAARWRLAASRPA